MRPVLSNVHLLGRPLALHSYGVAVAVGFLLAIFFATRTAARRGGDPDGVRDLCFWLLISSLVGARLLFILTNLPQYARLCRDQHECFAALEVWQGGLVFYGGFFGALVFAIWYMRRRALPFWRTADFLAPAVPLGQFFGRLGCFAAGCCWGKEAQGPWLAWAARFGEGSLVLQDYLARGALPPTAQLTPPLHPVQLYEALGNLVLFCVLSVWGQRKRWDGQILCGYLLGYACLRLLTEHFRGDAARRFWGPLSTSQLIALLVLPLAGALWRWRRLKSARSSASSR